MSEVLAAALAFAARGWPVFPCRRASSDEVDAKGKPRWKYSAPLIAKGLNAASADEGQIRRWWKRWPDAMIGLPLGGKTGLFALDFDPRFDPETGEFFDLAGLKAATEAQIGAELPQSATAVTPSGGVHLFFRQPEDGGPPIRNKGSLPLHVDVRGEGGYVIAAPSIRFDGRYRWLRGFDDTPPAAPPAELVAALRAAPAAVREERTAGDDRFSPADDARRRYGVALLSKLTDQLGRARVGGRGQELNRAAFALGGAVAAGILSRALVEHEILAAAQRCGLDSTDGAAQVEKNMRRSLDAGEGKPLSLDKVDAEAAARHHSPAAGRGRGRPPEGRMAAPPAPPPKAGTGHPIGEETANAAKDGAEDSEEGGEEAPPDGAPSAPGDPPSGAEDDEPSHEGGAGDGVGLEGSALLDWCAWRPLTDLGNAERFRARYGRNYRFTYAAGWLVWDGRRWEPHHHGKPPRQLLLAAQTCVRAIRAEAGIVDSKRHREALLSWARKSEAAGKINAIVALFQPMVTVSPEIFDTDPLLFNVRNGTLAFLRRPDGRWGVELRPHQRDDFITKVGNVDYDPAATCPGYDAFLAEVQPDAAVRAFLHRWSGLSLTGARVQKIVQNYGTGRNGKGTMTELHAHIAGDYAGTINIESLLAANVRSGQGSSPDIAKLPGVRFLRVTEPEEGALLAESLVKRLTGGDPIDARHNFGPFFTFKPVFKLSFQGNYKLKIKGTDAGIWGRMRLVKWDVTIPDDRQDESLPARLLDEASGVLNHLLVGALSYFEHGLAEPEAVREETANYREDSDPVGQFLALCTRRKEAARTGARAMHEVYAAWARWSGHVDRAGRPLSEVKLGERLETANYKRRKSGSIWWIDVELVKGVSDFLDHEGNPLPDSQVVPPPAPQVAEDGEGWPPFGSHDPADEW